MNKHTASAPYPRMSQKALGIRASTREAVDSFQAPKAIAPAEETMILNAADIRQSQYARPLAVWHAGMR